MPDSTNVSIEDETTTEAAVSEIEVVPAFAKEAPLTPDYFPSLEEVTLYLQRKFKEFGCDGQKLRSHPGAGPFLNHLYYSLNERSIRLYPKTFLILCPGYMEDGCLKFSTRKSDTGKPTPCDHCVEQRKIERRRVKRKHSSLEAGLDHADPSSKAAVSVLTPDTLARRCKNTRLLCNAQKRKIERLKLTLKESIEFSRDEDNVMEVLKSALNHCTANAGW